jgi:hypothetical protein
MSVDIYQPSFSELLLSIKKTATEMMNVSASAHDLTTTLLPQMDLLAIPLPDPPPIHPQLVALGLDKKVVEELSQLYLRKAAELKQRTEEAVTDACRKPRSAFMPPMDELQVKLHAVHEKLYMRRLAEWTKETVTVARTIVSRTLGEAQSKTASRLSNKKRPFFNYVCAMFKSVFSILLIHYLRITSHFSNITSPKTPYPPTRTRTS